jgi:hypothetical protein
VAIEESKPDGSGLASMRNSNEGSLRRPARDELERLRADAPPHIFEMAEKLIDNSSGYVSVCTFAYHNSLRFYSQTCYMKILVLLLSPSLS